MPCRLYSFTARTTDAALEHAFLQSVQPTPTHARRNNPDPGQMLPAAIFFETRPKMLALSACPQCRNSPAAFVSSFSPRPTSFCLSVNTPVPHKRRRTPKPARTKREVGILWIPPGYHRLHHRRRSAPLGKRANTVAALGTEDPVVLPLSHALTPEQLLQEHYSFLDTKASDDSSLLRARRRRLNAVIAFVAGVICLPVFGHILSEIFVPKGTEQLQNVITGAFLPVVGILFAMLSSTAVAALRQRQQDLRDLLHQELSLIRMLLVMIKDETIVKLLLKYTLELESETFSHKQNSISYDYEVPGTTEAVRREAIFAESEETLWKCFGMANELRLRPEVEGVIRSLVTFRTKRRAVLDSGLPQVHFVITAMLGMYMLFGFGLLVANDIGMVDVLATRLLFGILLALLTLTYALITDLRDPFGGDYGVTPWRLYHTVELLQERLRNGNVGADRRQESLTSDSSIRHFSE